MSDEYCEHGELLESCLTTPKKIVVIGDIHGLETWQKVIDTNPDAAKFIFVGDYFDTFEDVSTHQQIYNFQQIVKLRRADPDRFVVLMGNHDFQYITPGERYSGYQANGALDIGFAVRDAVQDGLITIAHKDGDFLFTHAGVTKDWCTQFDVDGRPDFIVESINTLLVGNPKAFCFSPFDTSGYGQHPSQSPVWVRPASLAIDMLEGYKHIVGHTRSEHINFYRDDITTVDALEHGEYLIIEGEAQKVGRI